MELVKVVIHSLFGSKNFDNVFCFKVGTGELTPTSPATIAKTWQGDPAVANWDVWDPADPDYPDEPTPLQAIVGFITALRFPTISITGATISDGQKDTDITFPVVINQAGTRPLVVGDPGSVAPGSIVWNIKKQPAVMGFSFGEIELRGVLADNEIAMSGMDLLDWTPGSAAPEALIRLDAAEDASHLDLYYFLAPGGTTGFTWSIPRAYPRNHLQEGSWYDAGEILTMNIGHPKSRQTRRGKKRAASTP